MGSSDTPPQPKLGRAALFAFGGTLFVSATLLFAVQPMFAKMVLPRLGGAPGVWSVALVFFQAVLLAGYFYAHLLIRFLSLRAGALVHLGVFVLGALMLPLALAEGWGRPPQDGQIFWLVGLFGLSVGLPFFALSANAPLVQAWYARSGAAGSNNPYVLYGASNLGSFIALLGYPIAIEPMLRLTTQSMLWSGAYVVLGIAIAVLGLASARRASNEVELQEQGPPISARRRAYWVILAFVPSALLVAVTAHISTDIAAAPFMWVIPLALFLLTFVLIFREHEWFGQDVIEALLPGFVVLVAADWLQAGLLTMPWSLALHLVTFFVAAMVAHSRLYAARPQPARLTEFYLWMSFGGVLGGAFAGLAAPYLFPTILEYPILLVAAVALQAKPERIGRREIAIAVFLVIAGACLSGLAFMKGATVPIADSDRWLMMLFLLAVGTLLIVRPWPLAAASMLAIMFLVCGALKPSSAQALLARSFFGVHKVLDFRAGTFRVLYHGTTLHGAAELEDGQLKPGWPRPLTYYHEQSPMAEAIRAMRQAPGSFRLSPVGIVGLGAGSLACYREEGEDWHFYEIDRKVVDIARDSGLFKFVPFCAPNAKIHLGDARITLQDEDFRHELLLIDAFSSDAIPIHLLTREAVELYFSRLTSDGALVLHISNRHLDLLPVVGAIARDLGLSAWSKQDETSIEQQMSLLASSSVVVLARSDDALGSLPSMDGWTKMEPDSHTVAWTDDYSDILGAMLRRLN